MTDREAITMLEGSACTPVMRRAINKGIEALQEREERARGCALCQSEHIDIEVTTHHPDDKYIFSSREVEQEVRRCVKN